MNILVTGGAGFIGSNLIDKLIDQGHFVISLDDYSTGKRENLPPRDNLKIIQGDIRKEIGKVDKFLEFGTQWVEEGRPPTPSKMKLDVVFHIAGKARIQPSFKDPIEFISSNINGTAHIVDLAFRNKARLIYAGSSSFYHDIYANPYCFTKWGGEEVCKMYNKIYGVPTAITRFFNVYGPRQLECGKEVGEATVMGIFEKLNREGKPLTITGNGEQRRDFTHVSDICDGLILLAEQEWNADIFNIGTGTNHSINEVAAMFGGKTEYIDGRPGEAQDTLADISAIQELGYEPKIKLEDYIDGLLNAVK